MCVHARNRCLQKFRDKNRENFTLANKRRSLWQKKTGAPKHALTLCTFLALERFFFFISMARIMNILANKMNKQIKADAPKRVWKNMA